MKRAEDNGSLIDDAFDEAKTSRAAEGMSAGARRAIAVGAVVAVALLLVLTVLSIAALATAAQA
ncbi:hypothetical protein HLV35_04960 [Eggerthellaceae bacterium zg-997]|nr:hypothetical protein [Eggerthellaceae bacterium zg-997]